MPESVLPIVFVISLILLKIRYKKYHYTLSARIAMSVMLIITGVAHFIFLKGMALMLPEFIPCKTEIIYATGVLEILGAIGILIDKYQRKTGWILIVFFMLIVPANIYAASKGVNMKAATYEGNDIGYLWYRIPLQIVFILWIYFSCIYSLRKYK